jgi:hypothetical protein
MGGKQGDLTLFAKYCGVLTKGCFGAIMDLQSLSKSGVFILAKGQ